MMRLRLVSITRAWPVSGWASAVVAAWFCLVGAATWLSARHASHVPLCPMRLVSGIPCPTCGSGRAGLCVLDGRVLDAWRLNPLVCTAGLAAALVLLGRLALRKQPVLDLSPRERRIAWAAGAILLALNWCYVVTFVG